MGRHRLPISDPKKQIYLEWLLTPKSERDPSKMEDLAEMLGVTRRTLTKWKTEDKEFMEAWEARYLATVGSPERKQELLDTLYKTGKDADDPKHVQATTAYFNIVEGLRPQKVKLEVTSSPVTLTDEQLEAAFAAKVLEHISAEPSTEE
jgi:hypothetical protein